MEQYSPELMQERRQMRSRVEKFFESVEFGQGVRFSKQLPTASSEWFPQFVSVPTDRTVTSEVVNSALSESGEFPTDARVFRGVVFEAAEFVGGGLASMLAETVPETSTITLAALEDEERELFAWVIVEIPAE